MFWEAQEAGWGYSRKLYPHGPMPPDGRRWWHYLPIVPGMSAEDLRRVESDIEEVARHISGEAPVNEMVHELKQAGMSHQEAADTLGVSIDTVKRAVRSRR